MLLRHRRRRGEGSALLIVLSLFVACMIFVAVGASGALLYFTFPAEAKPQVLKPIGPDGAFAPPKQGDTPPPRSGPGPQVGQVAPDIEAEDLDGTKFKLSDYRGKVVVVDFWGDW